jgi:predicted lipid carrier protein YhbT
VAEFLSGSWLDAFDRALTSHPVQALTDLAPFVIEQVVVGVPDRGEVRYRIVAERGGLHVVEAARDQSAPDVRFTTDYRTAVALAQGRTNAQSALALGRLRLGGDISLLGQHAELFAALEDRGAELRASTTYPEPVDGLRT